MMAGFKFNEDGTLKPFSVDEVNAMELRTFGVKDGSHPSMTLGSQSCTVRREWLCKWDQLDNATCALLGGAAVYSNSGELALSRVMPFYVPDRPNYLAMEIESIQGHGSAGRDDARRIPAYKYARLMVRHELAFFEKHDDSEEVPEYDRYVETLPSTTETNYLTLPGSMMKFRTGSGVSLPENTAIPYSIGRPEPVSKIGRKWHRVPKTAWEPNTVLYKRVYGDPSDLAKRSYIGTVNKNPIFGMPSGTLLFIGVDEDMIPDPTARP